MQSLVRIGLVAVLVPAGAGLAAAQEYQPYTTPTFATLDRQDGESRVGGQLGFNFFDDDVIGDPTSVGIQIYGHYVAPSGFGGYGILPINYINVDLGPDEDSATAFGNIEGGGIYVIRQRQIDWVLHAGLTLPTAEADDLLGFEANYFGTLPRLTDFALIVPEAFAIRLGASPIFRSGQFVLRADVGFDVFLAADGPDEPDPFVRLNVGGGVDTGTFAILGELVNHATTDNDTNWAHTFAVSARFRSGALEPGIALGVPFGSDTDYDELVDFFLVAGLQGAI